MDGFIVVNKTQGPTSHDVCQRLRRILGEQKIGHTGTLDPMAEGALLIMIGRAARLSEYLVLDDKEYIAGIRFGLKTDTQDIWGEVFEETKPNISLEKLQKVIVSFTGKIQQKPPVYSAKRYKGKHLYEYARDGVKVSIPPHEVEIYTLKLKDQHLPEQATLHIRCSKGTYIRTLCNDIGEALGCGAVMDSLIRTQIGQFPLSDAYTIDQIEQAIENGTFDKLILPMDMPIKHFPRVDVKPESERIVISGNNLLAKNLLKEYPDIAIDSFVRIYLNDKLIAVGTKTDDDTYKPKKVFS